MPAPTIEASHLLALAERQRVILENGTAGRNWQALGDLARIYADEYGWTADGPAIARRYLNGLLQCYLDTDPDKGSLTRRELYDRPRKVAALRAHWGITVHPASPSETAQLLAVQGISPHRNTIANWATAVTDDAEVLKWAESHAPLTHPAPRKYPEGKRPAWAGDRAGWPEPRTWPPDRVDSPRNERAILLKRTGALLSEADPDGTREFGAFTPEDLVLLLRETAAARVVSHFSPEYCGRHLRHFEVRIFDRWTEHPESLQVVGASDQPTAEGGRLSKQVATAVQMVMHDVATGGAGALVRAASDLVSRRAIAPYATINHLRSVAPPAGADRLVVADADTAVGASDQSPVERLYDIAAQLRRFPELAEQFASSYVTLRRQLHVDDGMPLASMLRLRLADQSASLDIARLQNATLMDWLTRSIEETGTTPVGMAYMTLTRRDQAILSLKREDEAGALALVSQAFADLDELVAAGQVDVRSELEARHQLSLAATGDYVRIVERVLSNAQGKRRPPGSDGGRARLSEVMVRALGFAESTRKRLAEIEGEFGLPAARHEEGQISTGAWRVRTGIIVLRAELSAFTALEAKLAALPPASLRLTPAIEIISLRYRELISLSEVTKNDAPEIVTLGMWVALLSKGRLPVEWDLTAALRLCPFLDRDPEELDPAVSRTRPVDLAESTRWLNGRPLGVIGQCVPDGPVAKLFEDASGDIYSTWRATLAQSTAS